MSIATIHFAYVPAMLPDAIRRLAAQADRAGLVSIEVDAPAWPTFDLFPSHPGVLLASTDPRRAKRLTKNDAVRELIEQRIVRDTPTPKLRPRESPIPPPVRRDFLDLEGNVARELYANEARRQARVRREARAAAVAKRSTPEAIEAARIRRVKIAKSASLAASKKRAADKAAIAPKHAAAA